MTFDPKAILGRLREGGVRFVVIGGIAGTLHGSPYPTSDVDICAADDGSNLERLAATLRSLGAKEWDSRKEIEIEREWSAETLRVDKTWFLMTPFGQLDVLFEPAGTRGYAELVREAVEYEVAGGPIAVAHMEDLIRMKEVANRDRDLQVLPTLRKLAERRFDSGSDL